MMIHTQAIDDATLPSSLRSAPGTKAALSVFAWVWGLFVCFVLVFVLFIGTYKLSSKLNNFSLKQNSYKRKENRQMTQIERFLKEPQFLSSKVFTTPCRQTNAKPNYSEEPPRFSQKGLATNVVKDGEGTLAHCGWRCKLM